MKLTPEIAELAGAFAADGSMQRNHLCFWGNITEDRDYYDQRIKALFANGFNLVVKPYEKKSNSVYGFYICKKEILQYFREVLGFPIGSKTYTVRVPREIMESKSEEVWAAFIRGFCDSDGCLNFDKRYAKDQKILKIIHTYPRIFMKSASHQIIKDIAILLDRLEIPYIMGIGRSKRQNEVDVLVITINGRRRLKLWMEKIGFSNPVQTTRHEIFKKHGFVPVGTTILQRKMILSNDLDPWDFYPLWTRSLTWIRRQDNSPARAF